MHQRLFIQVNHWIRDGVYKMNLDKGELLRTLKQYFPEKSLEISETLELLRGNLEDTRTNVRTLIMDLYDQGKHGAIEPHNRLGAALLEIIAKIQEIESCLEPNEMIKKDSTESEVEDASDYNAYMVDTDVIYNLHEDFTYKRPAAFEMEGQKIEVRTWQQMLCKTCELLIQKDDERFTHFENDPAMKGRKQKLFSTNPYDMRNACKLQGSELYVETNLSANAIRNLILRMLGRFGIRNSEYKVYLRADYSGRH